MNNTPEANETGLEDVGTSFQRLHPSTILLKSISTLGRNLVLIGALYFSVFDQNILYTGLAAFALIVIVFGIATLIWSRFSYQIETKEIRIKSGLISRNNRSIPFDRIQDVSLEQKLIGRILGLATVKLETGSGKGDDGTLSALKLEDGEALRDIIRDYKDGKTTSAIGITELVDAADNLPLFVMDDRRILVAGMFNFSFVLLAVLGAVAQNFDFLLPDSFFDPRNWVAIFVDQEIITNLSTATRIGGVFFAVVSLITIGVVSGIARTYIREYGFRLDHVDSEQPGLRRRRGLFTLTDVIMPIHRVQAAIIATGPIRQFFGWYHLKFQSLASDQGGETDHSVAPCARKDELSPILDETPIEELPIDLPFEHVDQAYWWRDTIIAVLLLSALAVGLGSFIHNGLFAIVLLAIPFALFRFLGWRHHRYALTSAQVFVHRGYWRRRLTILPIRKIQTVDVSQSPLDHPFNLATVTIGVAGGSPLSPLKIMDIPYEQAISLRQQLT